MEKRDLKKYVIIALLIILVYLSYLIVKPFVTALLTAFTLAYLFFPFYKKIESLTKNELLSAFIVTFLIIIIILIPLGFIANSIVRESRSIITLEKIQIIEGAIADYVVEDPQTKSTLTKISESIFDLLRNSASEFLFTIPSKLLSLLVTAFALFYTFMIAEPLIKTIKQTLPVKRKDELIEHIGNTTYAIVYGLFATAIIVFVMAVIGFKLLGLESPFLLGLVIGILSLIPLVGPAVLWLPLGIIKILDQQYPLGIGILILGIIISLSETLIRIKIIGKKAKIHPIIIFLGIIGGVPLFGVIGVIVCPIVLSILVVIIKEYYPLKNHEVKS